MGFKETYNSYKIQIAQVEENALTYVDKYEHGRKYVHKVMLGSGGGLCVNAMEEKGAKTKFHINLLINNRNLKYLLRIISPKINK